MKIETRGSRYNTLLHFGISCLSIWINKDATDYWDTADIGALGHWALMHEVGHALGLAHTDSFNSIDNQKYSIMSYHLMDGMDPAGADNEVTATGLQILDIAALQEIYGRNYDTRISATTYSDATAFASTRPNDAFIYTIWDGGGTDTIDASGYSHHVLIDLRQGAFSSIGNAADNTWTAATVNSGTTNEFIFDPGQAQDNVAIAYYAVIENAKGTSADDILVGNAWNNRLEGNAGDDRIYGDGEAYDFDAGFLGWESGSGNARYALNYSGDDTLIGGAGDDVLDGGKGFDTADYSQDSVSIGITVNLSANQVTDGFGDTDTVSNIERFVGTAYADTFILGDKDAEFVGGNGADTYVIDVSAKGTANIHDQGTDGATDVIQITGVSSVGDVALIQDGNDLDIIDLSGTQPRLIAFLNGHFNGGTGKIETLEIDDGTTTTSINLGSLTASDLESWTSAALGSNLLLAAAWVAPEATQFNTAQTTVSPIVLDVDASGTIELVAKNATGSVYWDTDSDGYREASGWITGGDGMQALAQAQLERVMARSMPLKYDKRKGGSESIFCLSRLIDSSQVKFAANNN